MGFKIRKSIKIAPGLKVNLSKSGASLSVGKSGLTLNISKKAVKSTIGVPGTGISHTQTLQTTNESESKKINATTVVLSIFAITFFIWLLL